MTPIIKEVPVLKWFNGVKCNKKLQNVINENIEWFWKNDPCLEYESNINELWKYFKLWCIPNCKENFEDMDEAIIEAEVNKSYDAWRNWNFTH